MPANQIEILGETVPPGARKKIQIPVAQMYTHTDLFMPVEVVNGRRPGPRLFVSAAIHGDELNGIEIIRRLLKSASLDRLRGTLIAIPIVNVHGVLDLSRYLPDRRDLNRSFPGTPKGSLAARVANMFMTEIVEKSTHGIDLHTGALHRGNLPQIRANLDDEETLRLAKVFGVPVVLNSSLRDGSLREAANDVGIPTLLYEAGEALRFEELSIRAGVRGIINVMRELEMLPRRRKKTQRPEPVVAGSSAWVRAPVSGILRTFMPLGAKTEKGSVLAMITDPMGETEMEVIANDSGIIIGRTNLPLVHQGEAIFHIARYRKKTDQVASSVEEFTESLQPEEMDTPPDPGEAPIQ